MEGKMRQIEREKKGRKEGKEKKEGRRKKEREERSWLGGRKGRRLVK